MFPVMSAGNPITGYDVKNSLRFRSSASAYLSKTPASAGNRQIFTFSYWLKRGSISVDQQFYGIPSTVSTQGAHHRFNATDNLRINDYTNGVSDQIYLITTQVFRDPSAWYHIVIAIDTTQATAANRVKLYVNGTQVTSFSTATYPSQNQNLAVNQAKAAYIGYGDSGSGGYFDGYMADYNFIDGQALTPSSFGASDAITGQWLPKQYASTYGTNGFYLKFSDIATTSGSNAGLGKDFSGNGNYWTTNNISVTAGTTYDAMLDSPTLTSATVANYAVMNPLANIGNWTLSDANLNAYYTASGADSVMVGTMSVTSGKYYYEVTIGAIGGTPFYGGVGFAKNNTSYANLSNSTVYRSDGIVVKDGTTLSSGLATWTTSDVIATTIDVSTGIIKFYKNNTLIYTTTDIGYLDYVPCLLGNTGGVRSWNGAVNFGQRPFSYTPPTGFVRLNTYNLPDSTIKAGNKYIDATTYTGTGATLNVTNTAGFKPDLVWTKSRSAAYSNYLWDSVRGATNFLLSNTTDAESTSATGLTSFNSNGFTLGSQLQVNRDTYTFVGWQWQAGQGSTSSNTSGSITSTVSVNATAGFSVATFTGTGANATIGHGLGVAPRMFIVKTRSGAADWVVYHASVGNTAGLYLNQTAASTTSSAFFNNTSPTSSVFTLGSGVVGNGVTAVAYCWAEIAGFSKFGSYTGNGSADGTFIYTGFRPKFIIFKQSSAAGEQWIVFDTARTTYNIMGAYLHPSLSNAESTFDSNDFLSNGFKIRVNHPTLNTSGATYIYMAFAENPFKHSNAR
jgi:hypothetical protein